MPKISLIIRAKNEAQFLPRVLTALTKQTISDFEVIIINDSSTDQTIAIAETFQTKLNLKIIDLPPGSFTYPHACNLGVAHASSPLVGFLSGHSVPIFSNYLAAGVEHFNNEKVAGVYGPVLPLDNASIWEQIYYTTGKGRAWALRSIQTMASQIQAKPRVGLLGNTNAFIRRSLWQARPFNEKMVRGGEDTEWAYYQQCKGKVIVYEPKVAVYHSHGVSLWQLIQQIRLWHQLYRQARAAVETELEAKPQSEH